jgi:glycosyltransferase involved in cell wall biosynthesis
MSQKRILFISGILGKGGAERRTLYLINELIQSRAEVHLALFEKSGSYLPLLSLKCIQHKIKSIFPLKQFSRLISLYRLVKKIKPDVIYTNLWGTAYLVRRVLRFYHEPVKFIYGLSNTLNSCQTHRAEFDNLLRDENVGLVLQTDRIAKDVKAYRPSEKNIYVVPNIINPNLIRAEVTNFAVDNSNHFKLIHVGSFSEQKRHDRLLRVIELLNSKNINFQIDLLGDGPTRKRIMNMAHKLNLDDVIQFRGYQNNPFGWIANADLLLLTSDYEGMPMVLIEALTLGTPIVATDIEFGPREVIENGVNGFYVDKNNLNLFTEHVIEVLNNKAQFSERALESSKKFYIENHSRTYLEIMEI